MKVNWLARSKECLTRKPIELVNTDSLGRLTLVDGWWEAEAFVDGERVCFQIGGRYSPDPVLIARATDILRDYDQIKSDVAAFLQAESEKNWADVAEEIRLLRIRDFFLCWPKRPDDVEIHFDGPADDYRCWHCNYNGRTPSGLGL
ncbi:hypothetical protein [Paludisphaera borealis]|uniref:Uncharacterized protein n=1 Tax=Paludisphaera borealis TaxID=1387353 RepID=A0A1U7CIE1_9BACT|nr:hypothetical protein [Paludisphaera borealis]APW58702.1 hypothetical protein BSF38_00103 [Paludisphaera borealis]